jgi:hypothetical protein
VLLAGIPINVSFRCIDAIHPNDTARPGDMQTATPDDELSAARLAVPVGRAIRLSESPA